MADAGFNGTTASVAGSARTPLIDVEYTSSGAKVDITGCADSAHTYVTGIPDNAITITIVGSTAVTVGTSGATTITWFDSGTSVMASSIVTDVVISGSLDDKVTSKITVVPKAS